MDKKENRLFEAQHAFVDAYYKDNIYKDVYPKKFFQLWQLVQNANWEKELETNILQYALKKWLDNLFADKDEEFKKQIELKTSDVAKLVLAGVMTLPDKKCQLKKIQLDAPTVKAV